MDCWIVHFLLVEFVPTVVVLEHISGIVKQVETKVFFKTFRFKNARIVKLAVPEPDPPHACPPVQQAWKTACVSTGSSVNF